MPVSSTSLSRARGWLCAQVYNTAQGLADFLGKETCISQDRPGFIVNRVLMPMINEAFYTLMEVGSCCAARRSSSCSRLRQQSAHPMGAFELSVLLLLCITSPSSSVW